MNLELKSPPEVEGLTVALPPHLAEIFERADHELREIYGQSPGVAALVRMWLGYSSTTRIRREFEKAVLEIKKCNLTPNEEGDYDEDCL